ncbi:WXG100 family type VII secretion target [Paenibacillus athensensis]|uniref:ESAT-6-like protein n=1 Tax=Paenibacillus athensensis TaxID=1967502 RepID=A0A4Y8Q974_9BACL|nr:WXG100 family type VII secretion target [Paenibacillus athensensis]MCD1257382.1 WXG100 family type VII secretion target [Paenibacillus athensensis]
MGRKIVVDPVKLEAAAKQMTAQADDYKSLYEKLYSEVGGLKAGWDGVDNQAFVAQIEGFREDFQNMMTLMTQYAEFLTTSAATYKRTQTETINAVKKLTN